MLQKRTPSHLDKVSDFQINGDHSKSTNAKNHKLPKFQVNTLEPLNDLDLIKSDNSPNKKILA